MATSSVPVSIRDAWTSVERMWNPRYNRVTMGMTPSDLPVVLCAICANPVSFVEQATAVTDKDGRRVHWDCWLRANQLPPKRN